MGFLNTYDQYASHTISSARGLPCCLVNTVRGSVSWNDQQQHSTFPLKRLKLKAHPAMELVECKGRIQTQALNHIHPSPSQLEPPASLTAETWEFPSQISLSFLQTPSLGWALPLGISAH